jgi:DHA2 family multidrug resistance protein
MPVAGWMLGRGVDARWLIGLSLLVVASTLYWMTGLTLEVSPSYLIELRVVQTFMLGLFFVPVQSAAYLFVPKEQINNATGMVSMVRNEGSSVGVAVLSTLLARRSQFHQVNLGADITSLSRATAETLAQATRLAQAAGAAPGTAHQQALAILYRLLKQQAMLMAYLDAFMVFCLITLAVLPLVFLMRRSVTAGKS